VSEVVMQFGKHSESRVVRPLVRHPERASTVCQCIAPEPCYDPAHRRPEDPSPAHPVTMPLAAVKPGQVEQLEQAVVEQGFAPSVCQCIAPEPCRVHPDHSPYLARPHADNAPHPDSPVARTKRRLAADRAAGVLPGAEPGQGVEVLPFLTDRELAEWTTALLAEHHRRQQRYADYRQGAQQAGGQQ
jgi:hypothetical protein